MTPHCCPVCNGHGTVSKPPWIAGDVMTWVDTSTAPYPCKACNGTGIVWENTFEKARREIEAKSHVVEEGSRKHVTYYDNNGAHCSEPNCEVNI